MSELDTALIQLSNTISPLLFQFYLDDPKLKFSADSSLSQVLEKTQFAPFSQRVIERTFQDVADELVKSFRKYLNDIKSETARRYLQLSTESLRKLKFPRDILPDLTQANLTKAILRDDLQNKAQTYLKFLDRLSYLLINIAGSLPGYTFQETDKLFKDSEPFLEAARNIINETERMQESSTSSNPDLLAANFEEEYRQSISEKLDSVELFGAGLSRKSASRKQRLSVAYISLNIERQKTEEERNSDSEDLDDTITQSVEETLSKLKRLVIRGDAGSGKTTLLRWLAINSARRSFAENLQEWNETIPFFISLRQFVDSELPVSSEIVTSQHPDMRNPIPENWVSTQLKSGRGLLLIDGLDELPETRRTDVLKWLEETRKKYPRSRIILSTRPTAAEEGWLNAQEFQEADLRPMEFLDIQEFIMHWHMAVGEELHDSEEKKELKELEQNLIRVLKASQPLQRLMIIPLLSAVICALHRDRNRQLPENRIDLYNKCSELLLEARDQQKGLEVISVDYPQLDLRTKYSLLEGLSYFMMKNNWASIESLKAIEKFDKIRQTIPLLADYDGESILHFFLDRSGMIREPVTDRIEFTHRTFQEYLTARAIVDEGDRGFLTAKTSDDQWHEVIILYSGIADRILREAIIKDILIIGDTDTENKHKAYFLAAACLQMAPSVDTVLQEKVKEKLNTILPPINNTAAKIVAQAGDLAVPYLIFNTKFKATQASACIRALSLIRSKLSMEAILTYKKDLRKTVIDSIKKTFSDNIENEFSSFLAHSFQFDFITIQGHSKELSLELLHELESLQHLDLRNVHGLAYSKALSKMDNLKSLSIKGCCLATRENKVILPENLEELVISDPLNAGKDFDLSPIQNLKYLKKLKVFRVDSITDLTPIGSITSLSHLRLYAVFFIQSLLPISKLIKLRSLDIFTLGGNLDISHLSSLKNLTDLSLNFAAQVTLDISPLANLTNLCKLRLDFPELAEVNISPLANLTNLRHLSLNFPKLAEVDISPLANLKTLKHLHLEIPEATSDLTPLLQLSDTDIYVISDSCELGLQQEFKQRKNIHLHIRQSKKSNQRSTSNNVKNILHLSDLHFGENNTSQQWFTQLADDLIRELKVSQVDILVLSGDLANQSNQPEYLESKKFLQNLCEEFKIAPEQIILVPGNHDLNWDISKLSYTPTRKDERSRYDEQEYIISEGIYVERKDPEKYNARFEFFSKFYKELKGTPYPLEPDKQYDLQHFPDANLVFLGLNSAYNLDHHYKSRAAINMNALSQALDELRQNPSMDSCIKIAVFHHPLNSPYQDKIKDPGFVEQLAKAGFSFILHGHIHKADAILYKYDLSPVGRQIHIISAGTFGAPTRELVPGYPWQYNLIQVTENKFTVHTRRREEENGAWKPDSRWVEHPGEDPKPRYEIELPLKLE